MSAVLWLRRDLRRSDHPALGAAAASGEGRVAPLFVIDPRLVESAGAVRRAWLARSLAALVAAYDGALHVRVGDPATVVPAFAREVGASSVHVTRETTPYGVRRDGSVATELASAGVDFVATGTPYAVGPGVIRKPDGDPYRVFTPFMRAWRDHGWPGPATEPADLDLRGPDSSAARARDEAIAGLDSRIDVALPKAGEEAALRRWREWRAEGGLTAYGTDRNRPDRDGTSMLSAHLKIGSLHPRTLLADLVGEGGKGAWIFTNELAWREFYADVLWHNPSSAWRDLRPTLGGLDYDPAEGERVEAWKAGRTGYPIVDAGMRQLLATGWMHNRVRMITASFLTKDLHVWWPVGARHFMEHLVDGDVASNSHGWQWVAGTGTDAAPYFRVFNPVTQGVKFDPSGEYVRRWVPELAHLGGAVAHEPWTVLDGYAGGYVERIVDHAVERREALARLAALKVSG